MKLRNVNKKALARIKLVSNKSEKDDDPLESEVIKDFEDVIRIIQEENPTSLIKVGSLT